MKIHSKFYKKMILSILTPPYVKEKKTSFVGYNKEIFNDKCTAHLLNELLNLKDINFLISNSNSEFIKEKFIETKFIIDIIECKRKINSKTPNEKTLEILVSNPFV